MVGSTSGLFPSHLFYVTNSANGFHFLCDTGTEVSVISPLATDRKHR